jgi:DNA-directed RNA polymerase specialized sigma24 family protein
MAEDTGSNPNPATRLDTSEPMPAEAAAFARKVHGMLDGQPKDEATVARQLAGFEDMFDKIAAGLYSLTSMMAGEGEDSIRLVEAAVANAEVTSCTQPEDARRASRRAMAAAAIELLARRDAASLAAPEGLEHADTCIDDDDLDAASREELERMLAGPDRERVRAWLEGLAPATRTIFVLRAVAGFTAAETAGLLAANGGPQASGWSSEAVRELFRQGLCSLASQMVKAGTRD